MPDTRAIFFWMGGVLTQSVEPLMRSALSACGQPEVNLYSIPGFNNIVERLAIGQIGENEFCRAICKMRETGTTPEMLREAAVAALAPVTRVCQTINLLPESYTRWLIVDYPQSWFEQARNRLQVDSCFSANHIIFLQDSHLDRLVPDIFHYLAQCAGFHLDQCLGFFASSRRAVAALHHGFPSAIFVDAARMEREFVMRGFTGKVSLEHRPATVL